jgi:hypothetical protein
MDSRITPAQLSTLNDLDNTVFVPSIKCDIQELTNHMSKSGKNTTIATQNIRSIYSNLTDLQLTLSQLDFDIDILILTECRLNVNKINPFPILNNIFPWQLVTI